MKGQRVIIAPGYSDRPLLFNIPLNAIDKRPHIIRAHIIILLLFRRRHGDGNWSTRLVWRAAESCRSSRFYPFEPAAVCAAIHRWFGVRKPYVDAPRCTRTPFHAITADGQWRRNEHESRIEWTKSCRTPWYLVCGFCFDCVHGCRFSVMLRYAKYRAFVWSSSVRQYE